MIDELFRIGPLSISPFGVMMVVAFLAAWAQLRWGMKRLGVGDEEDASALLLAGGVGGIVGAKIYYAVLYRDWSLLIDRAGLVWYGALILGGLAVIWTMRRRRLEPWSGLDAAAPAVALGYALGRVGCFLVGDDFGYPTAMPWGVKFPKGLPAPTTAGFMRREYGADLPAEIPNSELVAVHPTQLYETFFALCAWGIGMVLLRRWARSGSTAGVIGLIVIAVLAAERFFVEFFRAKDDRFFGSLTLAQGWSLAIFVLVIALVWRRRRTAS